MIKCLTGVAFVLGALGCSKDRASEPAVGSSTPAAATRTASPSAPPAAKPVAAPTPAPAAGAADIPKRDAPHTPEVLAKFDAACDAGIATACFDSTMRRALGMGAPKDRVAAVVWAEKGCKLDDSETCGILAGFVSTGEEGVPKDKKRALEIHEKNCAKLPSSCSIAASYYHDGVVVPANEAKSVELSEKGCAGGDGLGCEHLAFDLANRKQPNVARAVELARKACGISPQRCETIGAFYIAGTGVTKDVESGVAFIEKACHAGTKGACERLEVLKKK